MTPLREAATMALEALEWFNRYGTEEHGPSLRGAEYAIREALAEQPAQQEPFGYFRYDLRLDAWVQNRAGLTGTPFYTSPQPSKPWVGLTDEEVDECYYWKGRQWTTDELVRHVEAKLREKNA